MCKVINQANINLMSPNGQEGSTIKKFKYELYFGFLFIRNVPNKYSL